MWWVMKENIILRITFQTELPCAPIYQGVQLPAFTYIQVVRGAERNTEHGLGKWIFYSTCIRPYPYKKIVVSRHRAHHFWRAHQEEFYFLFHWIWCIWYYTKLPFCESRSILSFILVKIRFYQILRSAFMIEIHFT